MPYQDREEIDAIRARTDIVEVIGKYMPLTKKGREYVGVCPFHDDHDPSLRVSPDKQIYKCFVCGAGGNVFTFIQKFEHVGFVEAVSKVAAQIGMSFSGSSRTSRPVSPYQPVHQALQTFADYSRYILAGTDGKKAMDYLRSRKFSQEVLDAFEIGYAPAAGMVSSFLAAKKLDPQILADAGLVYANSGLPVFHERILIPIHDPNGNPVGFTARILPGSPKDLPKYINTAQTPVYEKGSLIFNYHRAREHTRKEGYAVLCEGAMDVLGLEKAGIHTGVAMLGTALTPRQMQMLRDLYVTIRVFYDNDTAGQKAVWKFGLAALEAGVPFVVVSQAAQKDPDEIFIEQGAQALRSILKRTISFTEFAFDYLQKVYDLHNYEDKKTFAKTLADLIRRNSDQHEWAGWYDKLKALTGLDYSQDMPAQTPARRARYQSGHPYKTYQKSRYQPNPAGMSAAAGVRPASAYGAIEEMQVPKLEEGRLSAEKWVLAAMIKDRKYAQHFKGEIGFFKNPLCHRLSLYIYEAYRQNPDLDPASLISYVEEEDARDLLGELCTINETHISDDLYWDSLNKIKEFALSEQIDALSREISETADSSQKRQLVVRKSRLVRQRESLRRRKDVLE